MVGDNDDGTLGKLNHLRVEDGVVTIKIEGTRLVIGECAFSCDWQGY